MAGKANYSEIGWAPTNHMRFERRSRRSIVAPDIATLPGSVLILQQKWRHRVSRKTEWRDVPIVEKDTDNGE